MRESPVLARHCAVGPVLVAICRGAGVGDLIECGLRPVNARLQRIVRPGPGGVAGELSPSLETLRADLDACRG